MTTESRLKAFDQGALQYKEKTPSQALTALAAGAYVITLLLVIAMCSPLKAADNARARLEEMIVGDW
jgi:hypothetical protein